MTHLEYTLYHTVLYHTLTAVNEGLVVSGCFITKGEVCHEDYCSRHPWLGVFCVNHDPPRKYAVEVCYINIIV